jgi:hypothetical protein
MLFQLQKLYWKVEGDIIPDHISLTNIFNNLNMAFLKTF